MKSPEAFRTISEAAGELGVPQHVLRFWETKFSFIRPMKRAGGRRFYRRQDIEVLRGVQSLLHRDGYTIKGVQRLHREQGVRRVLAATLAQDAVDQPAAVPPPLLGLEEPDPFVLTPFGRSMLSDQARGRLEGALADLEKTKARLDAELAARIS